MKKIVLLIALICSLNLQGQNFFWSHNSTKLPVIVVDYGYLYNERAVIDARNMAPAGWHVSTEADWVTLYTYAGGQLVAGGKLREIGTAHWASPNTCATNDYGFNARGSGIRVQDGSFSSIYVQARWWTTTLHVDYDTNPGSCVLSKSTGTALYYNFGMGVRLVKDNSTNIGYVIGNDGRRYSTVTIGTQVWMSENLKETRYRNGDSIPELQDNASWSATTSGARCYYVIP